MRIHIHIHLRLYIHIHVHIHKRIYMYIYIHIYTYTYRYHIFVIYLSYIYMYLPPLYIFTTKQTMPTADSPHRSRNDGNSGLPAVSSPKSDTGLVGISVGTWESSEKWMVGTSIRLHYIQCVIYIYIYIFMMMIPIFMDYNHDIPGFKGNSFHVNVFFLNYHELSQ